MTVKTGARSARPRLSPLMVRILSGAGMLLLVVGLVLAGSWGVFALAAVITAAALWEFRGLTAAMGSQAPAWLMFPLGAFFMLSGTLLKRIDTSLVLAVALVAGLAVFLFLPGRRQGLGRWAMGLAGAIYVAMPFNCYLQLYQQPGIRGQAWVLFTVLAVVASDAVALLVGQRMGRHPFFPEISPNKTLEGAVAGLLVGVPVMAFGVSAVLGRPLWHGALLGLLVAISAQAGDLVESQMKRLAGVKDSGHLIPGHGGVLDRIDSILFPGIVVFIYASLFNLL